MKLAILCGGRGTRLREVSETLPKPMVPIGGQPIIWHIMKIYASHGIKAERDACRAEFKERRTADGRTAVVGSGYHPQRAVQTGIGPVTVNVPKVRAKDGNPVTFHSALVPPYVRKARAPD